MARILNGATRKAAKRARKEAQAGGPESPGRFGGHHASAAAASRAHAASAGSSARRSKAEQARFEKAQRSHSRTAGGRPGNQKTQTTHKKNLIAGRKKLTGRLDPPNNGTCSVFFADTMGKGGDGKGRSGEGKGKGGKGKGKGKGKSGKGGRSSGG